MATVTKIRNTRVAIEDLIDRTEALLPGIASRALKAERDRKIPQESIDEIKAAGLNRVMQPERWGGFGLDIDAFFEICWRLSSACGSTGWVYAQSAMQKWSLGLGAESLLRDFYAHPDVLSCCAFNPRGAKVEAVDDGWMLSGHWQYASGCMHAEWSLLAAVVPESPSPVLLLVPREDYSIEDTWFVSGLKGTGSNDIRIEAPVFVPNHRFTPVRPRSDDALINNDVGSYGAPPPTVTPWGVVTPVIGMAQGALSAFEDAMRSRVSAFGARPVSQMVGPQIRISEASAKIEAARAVARSDMREVISRGAAGDKFSDEDRVRLRRDHAYVVDLCYDATMLIARAAGASSLFETSPIQRFLRDVHAGAMQIASNWDEQAESYGRVRMGLEPNGVMW